jgi:hypothetical protein
VGLSRTPRQAAAAPKGQPADADNINNCQALYFRKFSSDCSVEMSRSVKVILEQWLK